MRFGLSFETAKLGLKNLRLHKLRSSLTALGIICGVAAVICMLSISEGASESEMQLIRLLGTSNIIVKSVKPRQETSASQGNQRLLRYGITERDLAVIRKTLPHIVRTVPLREVAFRVSVGPKVYASTVVGAPPDFFSVIRIPIAAGRTLVEEDQIGEKNVCVIGDEIRRELFPLADPIGQIISVHNYSTGPKPYVVVGVIAPVQTAGAPARGLGGRDLNKDVIIPLATADAQYGTTTYTVTSGSREVRDVAYSDLYIEAEELEYVIPISEMVTRALEHLHDKEDYVVRVPLERLRLAEQEKRNRQFMLGSIAGVSLLVGGIGIMNIMLASVTERTREIGIRRALGAKQRHITAQFLVETVVLSTCGGLLGVVIGWIGAEVISQLAEWPTIIRPWTVVISFGLSVLIGVFFGMYPAVSAAKLDPIEALRHE